jgi:hypothetical protein
LKERKNVFDQIFYNGLSLIKHLKLKKFDIFFYKKLQFYLSKLNKKPSALKREHPALKNMKLLNLFMFLRVILPPGSGSGSYSESGSGSTDLIKSGSNPYPKDWRLAGKQV